VSDWLIKRYSETKPSTNILYIFTQLWKKKGTRALWIRFSGQKGTAKGIKGTHPSKVLSQEVMKMDVQKVAED
jgi:hypothetical protein